jgi:hypothetical protein
VGTLSPSPEILVDAAVIGAGPSCKGVLTEAVAAISAQGGRTIWCGLDLPGSAGSRHPPAAIVHDRAPFRSVGRCPRRYHYSRKDANRTGKYIIASDVQQQLNVASARLEPQEHSCPRRRHLAARWIEAYSIGLRSSSTCNGDRAAVTG